MSGGIFSVAGTLALCAALPRFWSYRRDQVEFNERR